MSTNCGCPPVAPCFPAPISSTCIDTCSQIDATKILYKKDSTEIENPLSGLDIALKENLESILEKFGVLLLNQEQLTNPSVPGQPSINTFQEVITYLLSLNTARITQINSLQAQITSLNTTITNLTARVAAIEKPGIIDNQGLGFTQNSTIKVVLQTIADNI